MDLGKAATIGKLALGTAAYKAVPTRARPAYARWLRREVESAGCMYVKIGQWVSSRTDVFPQEVTDEFAALRTSSAPMPLDVVMDVVGDMGFERLDETPVSTGSIAQVHVATLGGREVAVKVQRPGLLRGLQRDVGVIKAVVRPLQTGTPKMYDDLVSSLDDLLETVTRELDFRSEAEHMRRFREFFSGDRRRVVIPEVIAVTPRAIVMEYLPSAPFSGDAGRLMELFFAQFFELGWLHTDMHSGNLGLDAGSDSLVLYDFGSVLEIDEDIRLCIKHLMVSYLNKNTAVMVDYMLEFGMLVGDPPPDERRMLEDFVLNILDYVEVTDIRRFTANVRNIPSPRGAPTTVFRPEIFMIMRSFTLLEGLCKELDPDFVILDAVAPLTEYFVNDPVMLRLKIEDDIRNALYMLLAQQ